MQHILLYFCVLFSIFLLAFICLGFVLKVERQTVTASKVCQCPLLQRLMCTVSNVLQRTPRALLFVCLFVCLFVLFVLCVFCFCWFDWRVCVRLLVCVFVFASLV